MQTASNDPHPRIGVTVLAGFLGSGKTTLLRRIVRDESLGSRIAVLVNELGALGLDEELIRSESRTEALFTKQLMSGCICCTLRGELAEALTELSQRDPPPEHLIIETSGAALASEVSYGVNAASFDLPFFTDSVITLVDAYNAERSYREHQDLFSDQVRTADLVVINKTDLVPDPIQRAALWEWLRELAPRASWIWTQQANLDPSLLLGLEHPPEKHHRHDNVPTFSSVTLDLPEVFDRAKLEDSLDAVSSLVFRVKGVVDVVGETAEERVPLLVQVVGDRIDMDEIPKDSSLQQARRRLILIGVEVEKRTAELRSLLLQGRAYQGR